MFCRCVLKTPKAQVARMKIDIQEPDSSLCMQGNKQSTDRRDRV